MESGVWSRRRRFVVWGGIAFCVLGAGAILWIQRSRADADLRALIAPAARRHRLDAALVEAVVRAESGARPRAVSPARAYGLMQLRIATASELAGRPVEIEELFDPAFNLDLGCRYLGQLLRRYDGNLRLALMAYNAGMGNVDRWLRAEADADGVLERQAFPATRAYVHKVEAYRRILAE